MNRFLLFLLITLALLTGCAKDQLSASDSAKADYQHAKELIDNRSYSSANLFLEKFSTKHPYSQHIAQAALLRIFASFKNSEYILSETLALRFLTRHPNHHDISYAQYMLAMSYLKQTVAFQRDPAPTEKAIKAFRTIIDKYPNSSYVQESSLHLQNLRNKLALHELYIGKYYFDHQRYIAASNRFQVVLKKYQTSPAIEEALYYLSASYAALKLADSARDTAILLRHNYPKSEWSEKAADFL
ncbi:MAG: outer membrane protein assembly factor BamD [Mariprofundaceae bacterium]